MEDEQLGNTWKTVMCCFRWKLFIGGHVLPFPFLLPQFQKENFAASLLIRLDFRLSIGSGFRTSFPRRCGLVFQRAPGNRGWNNRSTERKYGQSDGWTFQKKKYHRLHSCWSWQTNYTVDNSRDEWSVFLPVFIRIKLRLNHHTWSKFRSQTLGY